MQVNGTLVTHSNHVEVVKLIKCKYIVTNNMSPDISGWFHCIYGFLSHSVCVFTAGSYVALTVLGRPPGLPQIPLSEGEGDGEPLSSLNSPHSPIPSIPERSSSSSTSPSDRVISPLTVWVNTHSLHLLLSNLLLFVSYSCSLHFPQ